MAFTTDDFEKIWASTSPLTPYEFSEANYTQGWNFIGSTPPARQMWDFLQKRNDEKAQWLYNNKLSLSGGTMTGTTYCPIEAVYSSAVNDDSIVLVGGGNQAKTGGQVVCVGENYSNSNVAGGVVIRPRNSNGYKELVVLPDGRFTWDGNAVESIALQAGTNDNPGYCIRYNSGVQMCWGVSPTSNSGIQVTFLYPFKATPRIIGTNLASATDAWAGQDSATGFRAISTGTPYLNWFAIGRWK